jgi:8-oxo-dGTP pyrophosphatase MutT (NUDIX family)
MDLVKSIIGGLISGIILMLLFKGVTRIWNLELTIPQKLGIYAFISITSLAVILWYYFKVNPFTLRGLKHIRLYIKGYRFKHLSWDEIFNRYGGRDKFIGTNDFHIPWIEIFRNKEGLLKEEDFSAEIVRDEKGNRRHKRYNLYPDHLDPSIIEDVLAFNVRGRVWDNPTGRFIGFMPKNDLAKFEGKLYFEATTYFDYLVSNLYIDTFVPSLGTTIRESLEPNGGEDAFNNRRSANHAGVTALLLCSNNKLILLHNRSDNATYPNQICASTSGTLELGDLVDGAKPSPPFEALRREMYEELHLPKCDLEELRLLAIARDMTRGGSPEFIFFAKTGLSSGEVRDLFSRAYRTDKVQPHEIKSIREDGFDDSYDIHLHFSRDLLKDPKKKKTFNLPAMAAVYFYEEIIYHTLEKRN